ncbi:MAG: c-type cytochrome biogenesis protein CcmI [Casimicrobiaceae bacterium]
MIAFVVIAAMMVAAALAWILVPLLRGATGPGVAREASNVSILRDQLKELETDLGTGVMPREQYEQARRELEGRVLEESKAQPGAAAPAPSTAGAWTAAIVAGSLPLGALLIYVALGNFTAFAPLSVRNAETAAAGGAQHDVSPEQIEKMIAEVKARLAKDPGQAEGWVVLARTYYQINRYPEAADAFEHATALVPGEAGLLADYADALAAAQGGTLQGKPMELVARALAIDPAQWKALALAGTAAFDRKDYAQAVTYWEQMKATVPSGSPLAQSIDSSIAEARELGGVKAGPALPPPAMAKAPAVAPATPPAAATGRAAVAGTVTLAPALAAKASPDDVVFVFARAAQGPKMPLAILKKQVRDLPITFTLDDSMAMAPNMSLANFPDVVVGARVSKSGQAIPQSGDFEGLSAPVKIGTSGIAIVIEKSLP